ncbi:MAG: sensor histidine kinase [Caulobacter sp.]|nr:sensor histidine kinase [Caulobacter sp.]
MAEPGETAPARPVKAQLSEILDSFDEGFCAFDRDWRITQCNRAAEQHTGIRREDAIGRLYWEVVPGAVGAGLERTLREAMESGVAVEVETASAVHPGAIIALRAFAFQGGLAISFRDITEERARQQAERDQAVRLDLALAAAGLGDWSWEAATDLVTFSARAAAIFGLPAGPVLTWSAILPMINALDRDAAAGAVMGALEARGGYQVEYRVRPPGRDSEIWVQSSGQVQCDADGAPTGIIGVVSDITAAKAREARVRESEARFRLMADGAPAPVWVTTAEGPVEFVNRAFCEYAGLAREDLLGNAWLGMVHPDDIPGFAAARAAARAQAVPQPYTVEARFRNARGEWRWMSAISRPRFDEAGVFQGYVGIAMDMTDIRAAEARQQLMINELNHRVKNTLATVQSLAEQTARLAPTKEEFKDKFLARLMALNAAHNRLTQSSWDWTSLAELAGDQLALHGAGARLTASGPPLRLPPRAALSISLALHELATNAVKYGALQGETGRVSLTWSVRPGEGGESGDPIIDLEWREDGGPSVVAPTSKGFGSRLLETLGRNLGGQARLDYRPQGLRWTASFPRTESAEGL